MSPRFIIGRRIAQIIGFILPNAYFKVFLNDSTIYQGVLKKVNLPILNCYACPSAFTSCPLGSFQHFIAIRAIPFFVTGVIGLTSLLVGRLPCGWVCPFGFFQDLLAKVPVKKFYLPREVKYFKYVMLIVVTIILVYVTGETWFCKFCPQGALQGGIPQVLRFSELRDLIGTLFWAKLVILAAIIVLSMFNRRFFCKVLCPLGALLAIFQKVSVLQIKVDMDKCSRCDLCKKVCPVDISIYENPADLECIRCLACLSCPKGAIRIGSSLISEKGESLQEEKI